MYNWPVGEQKTSLTWHIKPFSVDLLIKNIKKIFSLNGPTQYLSHCIVSHQDKINFITGHMVLCFRFVAETVLITQQSFSFC